MEYPWRSRPPTGNFCPVCSHSHFPFCTPPPPQYFRPPPPPPDQFFRPPQPQASYDPFVDHQGGPTINPYPPPPAQIPPRPWNSDPNYGNPNSGLDHDITGHIGVKRMRYDNVSDGYAVPLAEEERRLKLIRDHGAVSVSHGLDRNYEGGCSVSHRSYEPSNFQGMENGYRREINSSFKQNYGEIRASYPQIENNRPVHDQSKSSALHNHGYGNNPGANGYRNSSHNLSYQEQRRDFSTESNNQFLQQHRMEPQSSYYSQGFKAQPPLPTSPPPPLPMEPPRFPISGPVSSSAPSFHSPYSTVSEAITPVSSHYTSNGSNGYPNPSVYHTEEIQMVRMASSKTFNGENEGFPPRNHSLDKPKIIDASYILKHPHRTTRPDHIVIILRGLPGSGKSYLAKILRDIEVENGGTAPRIHSMDEYFMTEIEKAEENEASRSKVSTRGKKPVTRTVMEYCYEPEMEEAYRSSMLKAFKKTLDEGAFPFVIVDDRNLRVADFAQFWATAKILGEIIPCHRKFSLEGTEEGRGAYKPLTASLFEETVHDYMKTIRSGYEVYLLEATYKDPAGCAARNVHGFTQNDIFKMANKWEDAPSLYMKLDGKSLLHGDVLEENGIEEVDMDTEDGSHAGDTSGSEVINFERNSRPTDGASTDKKQIESSEEENIVEVVKDLGKSKWSNDLDDVDVHKTEATQGNFSALSSLTKSYSKKGKSVRWADQIGRVGFSISAGKTANVSLIIGPGSGYNLKSNPLLEEAKLNQKYTGESRKQNVFQEQLRAEHESFKAVFDKRKHRIGGIDADEE